MSKHVVLQIMILYATIVVGHLHLEAMFSLFDSKLLWFGQTGENIQ